MTDAAAGGGTGDRPQGKAEPSLTGTLALVVLAMAGLFAFDTFLAAREQAAGLDQARAVYEEGQQLLRTGNYVEASDRFRTAVSIVRTESAYQLALGEAQLAAGRLADAEVTLGTLLQRDGTSGSANLAMARVLTRRDRIPDAISFYHRAIYGRWAEDPAGNQVRARLELIDLMVGTGQTKDLLAELLPLEDMAAGDLAARTRLGRWFILAGSPARALAVFRSLARRYPGDPGVLAGVGEATLAMGDYRAARDALGAAVRSSPGDAELRARLALADQVLALDPTQRGLGGTERYRRSVLLGQLALDELNRCAGASPPASVLEASDRARRQLKRRTTAGGRFEASEANLEVAEQLWQLRRQACSEKVPASLEPLALVLAKIAR